MSPDLKDPGIQRLILGGIVAVGIVYAFYALVYSGQTAQIALLEARLRRIDRHVELAKKRVERHNIEDLKVELGELEGQLQVLERLLPKAEEVPDFLEMVERKGIRTGITAILFEPAGSRESQLYEEQIYKVSVRGRYHDIGAFLARIGNSPRIVKTSSITLVSQKRENPRKERDVVANFELSTFVLSDDNRGVVKKKHEKAG